MKLAKPARTKKKKAPSGASRGKNKKAAAAPSKGGTAGPGKKAPAKKGGRIRGARPAKQAKAAKGSKAPGRGGNKVTKFLREVRLELTKVTWPTRDELVQSTIAVVVAVAVTAVFIFVLDVVFSRLIQMAG